VDGDGPKGVLIATGVLRLHIRLSSPFLIIQITFSLFPSSFYEATKYAELLNKNLLVTFVTWSTLSVIIGCSLFAFCLVYRFSPTSTFSRTVETRKQPQDIM